MPKGCYAIWHTTLPFLSLRCGQLLMSFTPLSFTLSSSAPLHLFAPSFAKSMAAFAILHSRAFRCSYLFASPAHNCSLGYAPLHFFIVHFKYCEVHSLPIIGEPCGLPWLQFCHCFCARRTIAGHNKNKRQNPCVSLLLYRATLWLPGSTPGQALAATSVVPPPVAYAARWAGSTTVPVTPRHTTGFF